MSKKLIALLLSAVMLLSLAAACGSNDDTPSTPSTPSEPSNPSTPTTPSEPSNPSTPEASKKVYKTYLSSEVSSLFYQDNVDSNAGTPAQYTSSQLWRMAPNSERNGYIWIDDLAVGDPEQVDDYTWNIHLREGAKFHNGDPITADTWIFTFQQQLNPNMGNRMSTFLANNAVKIVNATEYSLQGTEGYPATVDWSEVGLQKVDEYTIQIKTVEANASDDIKKHFDNRNNTPINEKMWADCLSADGMTTSYGSDLNHYVGCGPYKFDLWEYDSRQIYVKNEEHWLADWFNYDEIDIRIVPEMNSRVELFEQGEIYDLTPDANTIETYYDDPRMTTYGSLSVNHIDINCKNPDNPISGNVNYRKAIYHAIDREMAAESIFGHMKPSGVYVNEQAGMLSASALTYRESKYGKAVTDMVESWSAEGEHYGYNPALALEYLNKALEEENVPEGTVITVKYAIDEGDGTWKALGEYLMEEWPVIFEGKMNLEIVMYAGMSATSFKQTGDDKWDLSPNDWTRSMSRNYPYTCFYYYISSYSGKPNNFTVDEFDAQYDYCESIRMGDYDTLLAETQKLEELYLQYVIHVPVYQAVSYQLFNDCLQLPVDTYIPGFGWGAAYGDIAE